ncbi:MAG: bifunctional heptose 7-phosphate kinase/heptose 1-phosphate adenyltransferase [Candidatus Thorarchaeota archaeon]
MTLIDEISKWDSKKLLIIGDALIDKYIFGYTDKISPDAPVPNVKIEKNISYIGATGLVLQFIKSFGGTPEVCTIIGNDYEGEFYLKSVKELEIDSSGIIIDKSVKTPQITRIKAMNQHLLRLETDYDNSISGKVIDDFKDIIINKSKDIGAILILDYGLEGIFTDVFIQNLLQLLKEHYESVPIIVRPTIKNYYLYENVDLIKMNLQKALDTFSIDCCNETSVTIAGKRILNSSRCRNLLLNYLELDSYLFTREFEKVQKIPPIIQQPIRSYVAVGSVIMAVLGLAFASKTPILEAVKLSLNAAALTATRPPVDFFKTKLLNEYIKNSKNNS